MAGYYGIMNKDQGGGRKRCDTLASTHSNLSLASTQTAIDLNGTETIRQQGKRSLRHVASFSTLIRSTSVRSIQSTMTVDESASSSKPGLSFASRRQSLTRATASSLAKMVNFSANSTKAKEQQQQQQQQQQQHPPPPPPPPSTKTKNKSRLNQFLSKKKAPKEQNPGSLPSPPETPRPNSVVARETVINPAPNSKTRQFGSTEANATQSSGNQKSRASWLHFGSRRPSPAIDDGREIVSPTSPCFSSSASSTASSSSSLKKDQHRHSKATVSEDCSPDSPPLLHRISHESPVLHAKRNSIEQGILSPLEVFDNETQLPDCDRSSFTSNPEGGISDSEAEPPQPYTTLERQQEYHWSATAQDGETLKTMAAAETAACEQDQPELVSPPTSPLPSPMLSPSPSLSPSSQLLTSPTPQTIAPPALSNPQLRRRSLASAAATSPSHSTKRRSMMCLSSTNHQPATNKRHSIGSHYQGYTFQQQQQSVQALMRKSKCSACTRCEKRRLSAQSIGNDSHHEVSVHHDSHTNRKPSTTSSTITHQHVRTNSSRSSVASTSNPHSPRLRSPTVLNLPVEHSDDIVKADNTFQLDEQCPSEVFNQKHSSPKMGPVPIHPTDTESTVKHQLSASETDEIKPDTEQNQERDASLSTPEKAACETVETEQRVNNTTACMQSQADMMRESESQVVTVKADDTSVEPADLTLEPKDSTVESKGSVAKVEFMKTEPENAVVEPEDMVVEKEGVIVEPDNTTEQIALIVEENDQVITLDSKDCHDSVDSIVTQPSSDEVVTTMNTPQFQERTQDGPSDDHTEVVSVATSSYLTITHAVFSPVSVDGSEQVDSIKARAMLVTTEQEEQAPLIQLVSNSIEYADRLDRLALELSAPENVARDIFQTHQSLISTLDTRENRYTQRVITFRQLLTYQTRMLAQLENPAHRVRSTRTSNMQDTPMYNGEPIEQKPGWNWTSFAQRAHWHVSQLLGITMGSGSIVNRQHNQWAHTTDIIVSGTCVTTEPSIVPHHLVISQQETTANNAQSDILHFHYLLHLTRKDRMEKFTKIPPHLWKPDADVNHCQWSTHPSGNQSNLVNKHACSVQFDWFHRRHHCRRCGHVVCQKHSANSLPLFDSLNPERGEWVRVCDTCFFLLLSNGTS